MALRIETIVLGPLENNSYLLSDSQTRQALVIDPSFNISKIIARINEEALTLKAVWLTHGHFDHFAGASQLIHACSTPVGYLIHEKDFSLWQTGGEGRNLGFSLDLSVAPNILLKDDQVITFASHLFTVLPTPGHTAGHVTYYNEPHAIAFCGDLNFQVQHWQNRFERRGFSDVDDQYPYKNHHHAAGHNSVQRTWWKINGS